MTIAYMKDFDLNGYNCQDFNLPLDQAEEVIKYTDVIAPGVTLTKDAVCKEVEQKGRAVTAQMKVGCEVASVGYCIESTEGAWCLNAASIQYKIGKLGARI